MPTYEYRCTDCGENLEVVQSFSDEPLTVCPACQGTLRKLFSAVGVVFKGSGFYKTDSRSTATGKGATKATGTDGPADTPGTEGSASGGSSAGSADKAPESKPAQKSTQNSTQNSTE